MARARIVANVTEVQPVGLFQKSVSGATVQIYEDDGSTPVSVYAAPTGGSPLTAPFTTDGSGRVIDQAADELWVEGPQDLVIVATSGGQTYSIDYPANPGAGIEVDYAEITSPVTITTPGSTKTNVSGLNVDVPIGTRPVIIKFRPNSLQIDVATRTINVWLDDGTKQVLIGQRFTATANAPMNGDCEYRLAVPTSAKNYQLQLSVAFAASGSPVVNAGAATDEAATPAYLQAVQV